MAMMINSPNFHAACLTLKHLFKTHGSEVHTERWQGADISKRPEMESTELLNASISVPLNGIEDLHHWQQDIGPNLPWADDHFAERVCGYPINPGVEWANWPWGDSAKKFIETGGQFNHNYMERYWPKAAGYLGPTKTVIEWEALEDNHWDGIMDRGPMKGIRQAYGDLRDLVELLANEPLTRQAWIPIFFPEDTGKGDGGRKPCTLGYQFIVRNNMLHVYYPLRSCDFVRHFRDDIYLTVRLLLWVLDRCREKNEYWHSVFPGTYTMHCTSLHIFKNDRRELLGE